MALALALAPVAITIPLLNGTEWILPASVALVAVFCLSFGLFRLGTTTPFALTAGGIGISSGLVLAVCTTWGMAPPIACALCGLGAVFLSGPVMQYRSVSKEASMDVGEEDAIAHRALSRLFYSLLTYLAILAVTTMVLSLLALNFDLGRLEVAGLTLISVVAIVAATVLVLAIRSGPEKNVK